MKSNILIICQNPRIERQIARSLANRLTMFYADLDEIMEYNFIDESTLQFAGKKYYEKKVRKAIFAACEYENAVLRVNFNALNLDGCWERVKESCLVIFLKLDYIDLCDNELTNKINELVFEDRNDFLSTKADIIVPASKDDDLLKLITQALRKYYNLK